MVESGGGSGIFIRVTKRMSPGDTELQPLVDILPFVIYGESAGEEEEEEGCC